MKNTGGDCGLEITVSSPTIHIWVPQSQSPLIIGSNTVSVSKGSLSCYSKCEIRWTAIVLSVIRTIAYFFCFYKFQVTDDKSIRRRIFLSTFRKEMKATMFSGFVPLRLSAYWDYIVINLAELTHKLFGTKYVKTVKIQVSVNRLSVLLHAHFNSLYFLFFCFFL